MSSLEEVEPPEEDEATEVPVVYTAQAPEAQSATYRLCANSTQFGVCNWAVPADDDNPLCDACRLNRMVPDASDPATLEKWRRLEIAKRRLLYTLFALGLPVEPVKDDDPGLAFSFMADRPDVPVVTGHADGLVTINISEADDAYRERMREEMGEAYRTLLGHVRHEVGHYYWDRLIRESSWLEPFRQAFGDERADYGEAMKRHYEQGPPDNWQESYVSAYATMHPWEDWAETFAHYLHMTDTLDTAASYGLSLEPDVGRYAGRGRSSVDRERQFRRFDRGLGAADRGPQQLQSLDGSAGFISVRALRAGHRAAALRASDGPRQPAGASRKVAGYFSLPTSDSMRGSGASHTSATTIYSATASHGTTNDSAIAAP